MRQLYYSWYSICSEKVLICLFEKDLPFEGHHVDLFDFDQVNDNYLSINPAGMVPTLMDGGRSIPESTVINEYLEDVAPQPSLRPRDPYRCAEMRAWVQRFQDIVFPAVGLMSQVAFIADELTRRWPPDELEALIRRKVNEERVARQLRAVRGALSAEEVSSAAERIEQVLDEAERLLGDGRDWLGGGLFAGRCRRGAQPLPAGHHRAGRNGRSPAWRRGLVPADDDAFRIPAHL